MILKWSQSLLLLLDRRRHPSSVFLSFWLPNLHPSSGYNKLLVLFTFISPSHTFVLPFFSFPSLRHVADIQGGSNMTGTDLCVNKCKQSRSYLNHLVLSIIFASGNTRSRSVHKFAAVKVSNDFTLTFMSPLLVF